MIPSTSDCAALLASMKELTSASTSKDLMKVRRVLKLLIKEAQRLDPNVKEGQAAMWLHALHLTPEFNHYRHLMDANAKTPGGRRWRRKRDREKYAFSGEAKRARVRAAYYAAKGVAIADIPPKRKYVRKSP